MDTTKDFYYSKEEKTAFKIIGYGCASSLIDTFIEELQTAKTDFINLFEEDLLVNMDTTKVCITEIITTSSRFKNMKAVFIRNVEHCPQKVSFQINENMFNFLRR
jgi:hypothetical protein